MAKYSLKILALLLGLLVLLLGVIITVVYLNQKAIVQKSLLTLNEQFVGEIEIDDSHIAPFANFPYISIDLEGIRFYENKDKNTKPLYEARDFYLGFDLLDILKGEYHLKKVSIENGHVDISKDEDGNINLLLAKGQSKQDTTASSSEDFYFDLQALHINNMDVAYQDLSNGKDIIARIDQLDAAISVSNDHFFIDIISQLNLDIDQDGEHTFFADKDMAIDLEMDYDHLQQQLEIKPSKLKLEEAFFTLEGNIDIDDDLDTNLKFYGEKPDFSVFAAFAPKEVGDALKSYENEGDIFFAGTVVGKVANGNTPAINVEFGCENAYFLNTNVNKKVDELHFSGSFSNGAERNLKSTELILQNFYAKPEEGIFEGVLIVRNFEDPYIRVNINADIDLEFLGEFFNMENLKSVKGQVLLDMDFDELMDMNMPTQSLAKLKEGIDSELTIKNLSFEIPDYPHAIRNAYAHAVMENGSIILDSLHFSIADADFEFSGSLSDFPAVFHGFDSPVKASLSAKSNKIDLSSLVGHTAEDSAKIEEEITDFNIQLAFETTADQLTNYTYLPKGEFYIEDFYAKLKNYPHTFHDFHADVIITETDFTLIDFTGEIDQTDFHFSGSLANYPKWFQEVKIGDTALEFDLTSNYIHPADLLSYNGTQYLPEAYKDEEIRDVKLHGKLYLHYDSLFKSADFYLEQLTANLSIHPLTLDQFNGRIHFEDEHVLVEDFSGKMGASDFRINMAYYTGNDSSLKIRDNYFDLKSTALDLDALMNYEVNETEQKTHEEAFNVFDIPFTDMRFSAVIDQMNYHKIWLDSIQGQGRITQDHYLYLDTLSLRAADGSLRMKGYFNGSDPEHIYFNSNIHADKLDIDKLLLKFETEGEDHFIHETLHGYVSGTIDSKFLVYPDFTPIIEKSEAKMDITVYDGSLVNFTPLHAMSEYFQDKNLDLVRFDTLQNVFELKEGNLHIPLMNINSSLGFIELSGRQGLDLSMDYFIRVPLKLVTQVGFKSLFGGKNKEEIDAQQEDAIVYRDEDKRTRFLNVNVTGTPEDFKVALRRYKKMASNSQ